MSRRSYFVFLALTVVWMTAAVLAYDVPYGWFVASAIVWWGLLVMAIATGYYAIQVAPAARVTPWLRRDLAINGALFLAVAFAILDGANGWRYASPATAGWIAFGVAAIHPLAVDLPHKSHHERDPAGSPVPMYVPPACLWIDWTLAALLLAGQILF